MIAVIHNEVKTTLNDKRLHCGLCFLILSNEMRIYTNEMTRIGSRDQFSTNERRFLLTRDVSISQSSANTRDAGKMTFDTAQIKLFLSLGQIRSEIQYCDELKIHRWS